MEFFIGMMVIGVIAGVFIMTILFGSERGFFVGNKGGQRLTIVFQKGGGISQNSLVLKSGIKIGRVYSVELVDDVERSEVHVSFELEPGAKIYSNEYAKINRTLLGDASIEFVDDPDYVGEIFEIGAEDVIPGRNTGDLMGTVSNIEGDLAQALQNINKASEGVTLFMQNLNTFLGDEVELQNKKDRLQNVFTNLQGTLESIRSLADNLDLVVSDKEIVENVRKTTGQAPKLLAQVNDLTNGAQNFMKSAQEIGSEVRATLSRAQTTFDLVDKNLDNVAVFTTSLADDGPQMLSALNGSSVELKTTIANIRDAVVNISDLAATLNEKIEDPNSPLGVLVDDSTGESLRHIVKNAEEISQKLYPILDDARVFTNKIAHRPSSLVWDRTTSKGVNVEHKFGMQTLSPNGGLSSPLYRQTAAGAKIRERNYYEPAADESYMDDATRAAYENAVAELREARELEGENGAALLPTVSSKNSDGFFSKFFKRSCAEKKERVRWSLASLWNSLDGNDDDRLDDGACEAATEIMKLQPYEASFVGYDQLGDEIAVGQPIYGTVDGIYANANNFDQCSVPSPIPQSCAPQQLSQCGVPLTTGCDQNSFAGGSVTNGAGYQPSNGFSGGYTRPNNRNERVGTVQTDALGSYNPSEVAEPEQLEELPPPINRVATPDRESSLEDDGLPIEFAPPTQ